MSRVHIGFVLDESSSMGVVEEETREGLVNYIKETRKETPDALFTLTVFNSHSKVLIDSAPINTVRAKKTGERYKPYGWTALYDAIGDTVKKIEKQAAFGEKVLIVIMTDGYENSSRKYNAFTIKSLIDNKKRNDWTFVFLGANIDSHVVGGQIGIDFGNTVNYNYQNTGAVMNSLIRGTSHRIHKGATVGTSSFFSDAGLEEDYTGDVNV